MKYLRLFFRLLFKILKWGLLLIVVLAIISALYNLTLPSGSEQTMLLSYDEKAYVAETMNLQNEIGDQIWPGWGGHHTPVIVYNESYAFLIGYPDPPAGWLKMPSEDFHGIEWELAGDVDFYGNPYYRQPLPDPDITPENFTVKVGERWVATMQTKEYAAVAFYKGFRDELPPVLNAVFPYTIFWNVLMGSAENYIGGLSHESFHSFQGTKVPQRLAASEFAAGHSSDYPWHNTENANGWEEEIDYLLEAYHSDDKETQRQFVARFIERRNERRLASELPEQLIRFEKNREWLEGLAKYAELEIGVVASETRDYKPVKEIIEVKDFKNYSTRSRNLKRQIGEVKRAVSRPGEGRFYYTGMLQAMMLDRLKPGWKKQAFDEDVYLEDLLEESIGWLAH